MKSAKAYKELLLFPDEEFQPAEYSSSSDYDFTGLFDRLAESAFRSRFRLSDKDREYVAAKGLAMSAAMPPTLWPSGWLRQLFPTMENRLP